MITYFVLLLLLAFSLLVVERVALFLEKDTFRIENRSSGV